MAKMQVRGMDEVITSIEAIGAASDKIFEEALQTGAAIVADEIRKRLEINLESHESAALKNGRITKIGRPTGDLLESFGIAPVAVDDKGTLDVKVGFSRYDRKHVANQLKARAMESGTSRLIKRPFSRPAINATRKKVQQVMGDTLHYRLKQIQEG